MDITLWRLFWYRDNQQGGDGYDGDGKPIETAESITKSSIRGYVIDEQTIFMYAGIVDEDYTDRRKYKIKFTFMARRMVRLLFPV
ncbi:DUF4361 domain-containing protein [Bacteroides faecis]|uniref:BT_3044 domain-containing protein n=1 Tax=Bacteroides faecis TaxID=674529 RepID=UPI0021664646|nr:DUF4361 domain-containing protein [Bacteroides faecis]MCS3305814.1 DUF4361 domain-containing protein [Bacteroides faecis]